MSSSWKCGPLLLATSKPSYSFTCVSDKELEKTIRGFVMSVMTGCRIRFSRVIAVGLSLISLITSTSLPSGASVDDMILQVCPPFSFCRTCQASTRCLAVRPRLAMFLKSRSRSTSTPTVTWTCMRATSPPVARPTSSWTTRVAFPKDEIDGMVSLHFVGWSSIFFFSFNGRGQGFITLLRLLGVRPGSFLPVCPSHRVPYRVSASLRLMAELTVYS